MDLAGCGIIRGMNKFGKKSSSDSGKRSSMGVYSSLVSQKKKITDKVKAAGTKGRKGFSSSSKKALAPLPKEQPARFFAHFRWERIKAYWFSKEGAKRIGKIFAACVLLGIIAVGALFVYYKSQLKEIELNDLTISETVNTYLDRNGVVLWEDKGDADYRLVVDGDQISTYVRQATVALEDRNFYTHPGIDIGGLMRAVLSTLSGKGVQGGSTLTQQLIKQVYFSDEAASANRGGISRKIKELILSIELEKMYSKEQIITMYLNESPYGGRRNGIESAAQTYFGKSAKDLTLAESALLAGIPNNPAVLNPYNEYGHEALIARQHKALDVMVEMGYITKEEADEAKAVPILDQILPESSQYSDMKAPHFVMEVKKMLEEKYGIQTMRSGGYTIKTTLDYRAQEMAQQAVANGDALRYTNGSDNIAMVSVDVETSQVIAMVGSIDWNTPVYGEVNAATSVLEPGSTIKPLLDYAPLFSMKGDTVYSPGSTLLDENIDSFYCAGTVGACSMTNATMKFHGKLTLRDSLANSLNIGAVKALAIVGIENGLEILHNLGDVSYCENSAAGLSMAIGSGCGVKAVEHANAYASIARGGAYKDLAYVLEVRDPSGKVLETWQDTAAVQVIDEQVAYEISSVLSDANARSKITFGGQAFSFGFVVPGVWTASKTGTTTTTNSAVAKDCWMISYSTALATVVWNGNHDGKGLANGMNTVVRRVVNDFMEPAHKELYASEGRWKSGDQPVRPAGIQDLTVAGVKDIWPSWYNSEKSGIKTEKVKFNSSNKLQATDCTPASLTVEIEVSTQTDPITGNKIVTVPDDYKYGEMDTCTSTPNGGGVVSASLTGSRVYITFSPGSSIDLEAYQVVADGVPNTRHTLSAGDIRDGVYYYLNGTEQTVVVRAYDADGNIYEYDVPLSSSTGGSSSNDNSR